MKVYTRADLPDFDWKKIEGKQGTIRISRDGSNELVAFQAEDGGVYILAWIDHRTGEFVGHAFDDK